MFPPSTTSRPNKRSLRELVRTAMDTALEFATLGEASPSAPLTRPEPPPAAAQHPHRRHLRRRPHARRAGAARPRVQVCTSPLGSRPRTPQR